MTDSSSREHAQAHDPDSAERAATLAHGETPGGLPGAPAVMLAATPADPPSAWRRGDYAIHGADWHAQAGYLSTQLPDGLWEMRPNADLTGTPWIARESRLSRPGAASAAGLDPREPHPVATLAPLDDEDLDSLDSLDRRLRAESRGVALSPRDLGRLEGLAEGGLIALEAGDVATARAALEGLRDALAELAGPAIGGGR